MKKAPRILARAKANVQLKAKLFLEPIGRILVTYNREGIQVAIFWVVLSE